MPETKFEPAYVKLPRHLDQEAREYRRALRRMDDDTLVAHIEAACDSIEARVVLMQAEAARIAEETRERLAGESSGFVRAAEINLRSTAEWVANEAEETLTKVNELRKAHGKASLDAGT